MKGALRFHANTGAKEGITDPYHSPEPLPGLWYSAESFWSCMSASVDIKGNSDRSLSVKGLGSKATLPQATSPWAEWDQHAIKHPLLELCQCLPQLAVPLLL